MPVLIAWAASFLVGPIVWKIVTALGIGVVAYEGLDILFSNVDAQIQSHLSSLAQPIYQLAGIIGMIQGIQIIMTAISIRIGVTVLRRIVLK